MNITGEAINSLSKRSRIPPCPGNIFPESFTPAVRLSKDSHIAKEVMGRIFRRFGILYHTRFFGKLHYTGYAFDSPMDRYGNLNLRKILPMTSLAICARTVDVYLTYNLRYMRRYRLSIRIQKEPSANIRYS